MVTDTKMPGTTTLVWNADTMKKAVSDYLAKHGGELMADLGWLIWDG